MYAFHARVWARPAAIRSGGSCHLRGLTLACIGRVSDPASFPVTFEEACETLARLPRLFIEPDGALVWVGENPAWQLDGTLVDREDRLLYVELRGKCPATALDELLSCLGWSESAAVFELVQEGVWLEEREFRRYASE